MTPCTIYSSGQLMVTSTDGLSDIGSDIGSYIDISRRMLRDATTDRSLVLAASTRPEYAKLFDNALKRMEERSASVDQRVDDMIDHLIVELGKEILQLVPGKVSTEIDAWYSFNTTSSVHKALSIIELYKKQNVSKDRILIKIVCTWEGIKAVEILQRDHGINCVLTHVATLVQAVGAAEAKAYLISPFVGYVPDYDQIHTYQERGYAKEDAQPLGADGPYWNSVIAYYRKFNVRTAIVGASFRAAFELMELGGYYDLTISPNSAGKLVNASEAVVKRKDDFKATSVDIKRRSYIHDSSLFNIELNEHKTAADKLLQGIEESVKDTNTLKAILKKRMA